MPTPEWIKEASRQKRKRVCEVCGAEFMVKNVSVKGVACSAPCLSEVRARRSLGRKASPETRAKQSRGIKAYYRSPEGREHKTASAERLKALRNAPAMAEKLAAQASDRMKRLHADPEWRAVRDERSSRTMKRNWETHRERFTEYARLRYQEPGGLNTPDANAKRDAAWRWILTKAQAAMHAETNYDETFARVQDVLRRENPYLPGSEDYYDYLKTLGTAVASHPDCRAIADSFMSDAIPRFAAEWKRRK